MGLLVLSAAGGTKLPVGGGTGAVGICVDCCGRLTGSVWAAGGVSGRSTAGALGASCADDRVKGTVSLTGRFTGSVGGGVCAMGLVRLR